MNYVKQPISLDDELKKGKISKELQQEFLQFLEDYPEYKSQALYLLNDKKLSIENIVSDLFNVDLKDQPTWNKSKEHEKKQELIHFHNNQRRLSQYELVPKLLFREWKQEHGFDSPTLEVGDTHTIIHLSKHTSDGETAKFSWSFLKSRYGKRGWGSKKKLSSISKSLLDHNSNPGWVVRYFLEENQFLTDINGNQKPANELPNPLVLNDLDTHALFHLILGNPYFFYQTDEETKTEALKNSFTPVKLLIVKYELAEVFLLKSFFHYANPVRKTSLIRGENLNNHGFILPGNPPAIVYKNIYSKLENNVLPLRTIKGLLNGVIIPKNQWHNFYKNWQNNYPKQPIEQYKSKKNFFPENLEITTKKLFIDWKDWLKPDLNTLDNQKPFSIQLHPSSFNHQSNKITFRVKNFDKSMIDDAYDYEHKMLYKMIDAGLRNNPLPDEVDSFTLQKGEVAQFLTLLEKYELEVKQTKAKLFAPEKINFSISIKKNPDNHNQYFLKGTLAKIQGKDDKEVFDNNQIRSIGLVPSYIIRKNKIYKIENMISSRLVNDILMGVLLEGSEINDFHAITIPFLKQKEINLKDPQGLFRVFSLYNYVLTAQMAIWEVEGILMGRLQCLANTDVGKFTYPLRSMSEKFWQKLDGQKYQLLRNTAQESALLENVYAHGWIDEGGGEYSMNEKNAKNFVLNILPNHTKEDTITYYGYTKLKRWRVKSIMPSFTANIKTNIDWFDIKLKVEHNNKEIDILKIIEIWRQGSQILELDDNEGIALIDKNWISKNAPIFERLIASHQRLDGKNLADESTGSWKIEKFQVGLVSEISEKSIKSKGDTKWKVLLNQLKNFSKVKLHKIPPEIKAELRDYQKTGINWLMMLKELGFCGILSDDMGLGKTLQTLSFLAIERKEAKNMAPALVIAPTSVVFNWQSEINKFTPHLKCLILKGPNRKELISKIEKNKFDIVITSYNILQRDIEYLQSINFSTVILDEAQMIKNAISKNAQAVFSLSAKYKISLTGTPIENSVMEIWSQFNFLMPGLMGDQKQFQKTYLKNSRNIDSSYQLDALRRQTKPFILRRMKQIVATELPSKTEQILFCEMNTPQKRMYQLALDAIRHDVSDKIKDIGIKKNRMAIFFGMLKLRQICCDPRLSTTEHKNLPKSSKMEVFLDTLSRIVEEGHRVLVFSQFVKMLEIMHQPLKEIDIPFLQLDGSVGARSQLINKFQNDNSFPVFLISLKAGGTGINLTNADYIIHYDPWWNPAVEAQATDRAYRIGQKNPVHVYKLIVKDSIEEKIQKLQSRKQKMSDQIIHCSESVEDMLNADDLSEIFDL